MYVIRQTDFLNKVMDNHRIWDTVVSEVSTRDQETIGKIVASTEKAKEINRYFRKEVNTMHWSEKHNVHIKDNADDMRVTFNHIVQRKNPLQNSNVHVFDFSRTLPTCPSPK